MSSILGGKKLDKKQIALAIVGGALSLVAGYFVWKHENAIEQQEAAATADSQADEANQVEQELAETSGSSTGYSSAEPANEGSNDEDGSTTAGDSLLEQLLASFLGTSPTSSTGTAGSTGSTTTTGTTSPTGASGTIPSRPLAGGGLRPVGGGPIAAVGSGTGESTGVLSTLKNAFKGIGTPKPSGNPPVSASPIRLKL